MDGTRSHHVPRSTCAVRYQGVSEPTDRDGLDEIEGLPVPRGLGRAGRPSFPYWFVVLRHSSETVPASRAKAKGSVFRNAACEPAGTPRGARRAATAAHQVQGCPRVMAGFMRCCPSQFIGYGLHDPDG